jgi:hypothetical protein
VQYAIICDAREMSENAAEQYYLFSRPSYDSVSLLYCGVPLPEAKLMIGYSAIIFNHWEEPF